jgi:hypothetical protein
VLKWHLYTVGIKFNSIPGFLRAVSREPPVCKRLPTSVDWLQSRLKSVTVSIENTLPHHTDVPHTHESCRLWCVHYAFGSNE